MYQRDLERERKWSRLMGDLGRMVGKRPRDLNGVLFLIGIQELGRGTVRLTKEEKQDILHIAICKVLSYAGYYQLKGTDKDGWPHWELVKKLPKFDLLEQESLLKMHVIEYFEKELQWQYTPPEA